MKFVPFLLVFFIISCASVKTEDLKYVAGKWKLERTVDNELWMERIDNDDLVTFNFLEDGTVFFFNKEPKSKEQIKKELQLKNKYKGWCGTELLMFSYHNSILRKGNWIIEDNILKINYSKEGEILRKNYQITHLRLNELDIKEIIVSN